MEAVVSDPALGNVGGERRFILDHTLWESPLSGSLILSHPFKQLADALFLIFIGVPNSTLLVSLPSRLQGLMIP